MILIIKVVRLYYSTFVLVRMILIIKTPPEGAVHYHICLHGKIPVPYTLLIISTADRNPAKHGFKKCHRLLQFAVNPPTSLSIVYHHVLLKLTDMDII